MLLRAAASSFLDCACGSAHGATRGPRPPACMHQRTAAASGGPENEGSTCSLYFSFRLPLGPLESLEHRQAPFFVHLTSPLHPTGSLPQHGQ